MTFDWDERKASRNKAKHGVSFDEARTVFGDPRRVVLLDLNHSESEDRLFVIGESSQRRVLVLVVVERDENVVRIISARKATRSERLRYANQDWGS